MMKAIISASILSANFASLDVDLLACKQAGVDWLHFDIMDGHFVPNISMGPFIVETCHRISPLHIDSHLMIDHPEKYVEAFARAGSKSISIHVENNPNVHRTIQQIQQLGCLAGVVINPGTPVCSIQALLPFVDYVLVMSVNPGFSGQQYIPESVMKIQELHKNIAASGRDIPIQVDGGVSPSNIAALYKAGACNFVTATSIFMHPDGILAGVKSLRSSL